MNASRIARAAAGALGVAALALAAISIAAAIGGPMSASDLVEGYVVTNTVIGVSFAFCGTVLAGARPGNPIGWLILGAGLCHLVTATLTVLTGATSGAAAAWAVSIGILLPLALHLFPTGRLVSPRWRAVAWFTAAAGALFVVRALPESSAGPLRTVSDLSLCLSYVLTVASLIVRYRRGDDARIAVVRYGLLDIRLVLSRTLVYGLLTAAVLGTYATRCRAVRAGLKPMATASAATAGAPARRRIASSAATTSRYATRRPRPPRAARATCACPSSTASRRPLRSDGRLRGLPFWS